MKHVAFSSRSGTEMPARVQKQSSSRRSPHSPKTDILGLGAVAVDDLIYVDQFPTPDSKVQVRHTARQCGGLTATALVAAARLGIRCSYAGTVGTDDLSNYCTQVLKSEGIDLRWLRQTRTARVFHSRIVVGSHAETRNIFSDGRGVVGASPAWPPADVIRSCRVLFLDHVGIRGMWRAAQIARKARIPIVADLERDTGPEFSRLFDFVDHLILSHDFATARTGDRDPSQSLLQLWNDRREVVIITGGAQGCWSIDRENPAKVVHHSAFAVKVADTTGCGDVFHGAYAAALAEGQPLKDRIRFASAAAALKATRHGGQSGIPNRSTLKSFLKKTGFV